MLVTLKELLKDADHRGYAVGMFNVTNVELTAGIIRAAEEERAPVILAFAEGHLPVIALEDIAPLALRAAERARVPVVLHLDHGYTYGVIVRALHHGFTSVMYDGSLLPFEENIARTADVVKVARAFGASVEAELGHVGGLEGGGGAHNVDTDRFTDPAQAAEFVERSGADALAVAVGTVHGEFLSTPKLDLVRLADIDASVSVPLVLHGGSGLSDADIRGCIERGIRKVNIFTDMSYAAVEAIRVAAAKKISYTDLMSAAVDEISRMVSQKIRLFGSSGKA